MAKSTRSLIKLKFIEERQMTKYVSNESDIPSDDLNKIKSRLI